MWVVGPGDISLRNRYAPPVIFLASDVRPPRGGADDALLRLAAETGADGVHLAGGCDLELYARLAGTALRLGVGVPSLALPLPERPLPAGRRLPRLSAHARDEREAAIALATRGLEAASTVAARFAVLDFGEVTLATRPGELDRAFARREMDEGEPGSRLLAAAVAERRARGEELSDACRWSLERLVRGAERAGLTLALPVAVTPWQVPSPREARAAGRSVHGSAGGPGVGSGAAVGAGGPGAGDLRRAAAGPGRGGGAGARQRRGRHPGGLSPRPGRARRARRGARAGASAPHIVTGGPSPATPRSRPPFAWRAANSRSAPQARCATTVFQAAALRAARESG